MPDGRRSIPETQTGTDLARRLAPGTLVAGRYRIVAAVGLGGMGVVYRAHDQELGMDVALKVLRPDLGADQQWVERFRRELVLAREVTHKNVVRIHDIGESDGLRFLSMNYVEGRSLFEVLDRDGPLPLDRALKVVRQVAEALQNAHEAGVVHRDLKPGNILLAADDLAFISDFGVARSLARESMTATGAVVGTPDYLSPEQIGGDVADARSDLYALGIVLYEMLTGELPFKADSRAAVLAQRLTGRARDVQDTGIRVPEYVEGVIRRCLERDPARRYGSASELLADLERGQVARLPARRAPLRLVATLAAIGLAVWLAWAAPWRSGSGPALPAAAPLARHGVAVLPLADDTADPGLAWSSTGLAELIAGRLSDSPELRVLDSLRVFRTLADLQLGAGRYDETVLRRLAELWEVDRLLAGNVRRAGQTLRVDLRLVSVGPGGSLGLRQLGAESADASGLFKVATGLADAVRRELGAQPPATGVDRATTSLGAAEAYRAGLERLAAGDSVAAAPAFERAVEADPTFAAALERLSQAYQGLGYQEKALAAAERAADAVSGADTRLAYRVRARLALLKGNPAAAEESYAELLRRYPNDSESLLDLAIAQAGQGEVAKAVVTLKQAAALDPGDPRIFFLLGKSAVLAGDARKAVEDYLVRALTLHTQLQNEQGKGDALNAMGVAFHDLGAYPQAIEKYSAAAQVREKLGDQRGLATSLRNHARVLVAMGRFAEAEPDLDRARSLYEKLDDPDGLADLLDDRGLLQEGRGDYTAARVAYQEALKIRRALGDEQKLAQSHDNVGYIFFLQGEYDNASVYWQQALERRRRIGDKGGVVLSTQNLGFLQIAQGRWREALKSFLASLEASRAIDFKNAMAVSHGNVGLLQHYEGRYGAALKSLEEALAILRQLDDKRGLSEFALKQAAIFLELGRLDAAKAKLDAAAPWLQETGNSEQIAERLLLLAEWHARRGENQAAGRAASEAVDQARASHARAAILRARLTAAVLAKDDAAIGALVREAESLGDVLLRIRASEAHGRTLLGRGNLGPAEQAVRRALRVAEDCGFESGIFRLHALLGRILAKKGDAAGAARAAALAAARVATLRQGLEAELRPDFDARDDVREAASRPVAPQLAADSP